MIQNGSHVASGSESGSEAETESQVGSESGSDEGGGSGGRVNQKTVAHNTATPVVRLKNPAVRLRSLEVKVAVVPLSQRQQQRRLGQTEKLQSLTPTPHNPSRLQSSTARKNGKPTIMV